MGKGDDSNCGVGAPDAGTEHTLVEQPLSRALRSDEGNLLARLLESPKATPDLREQGKAVSVVGVCSCGCPSIALGVPAGSASRGSDVDIEAEAQAPDGRPLDVILHVTAGQLAELEIWAGTFGGSPVTELPDPATLRLI